MTGSHLTAIADANEAQRNGWYVINKDTANGVGANAIMRVESEAWAHCVQTAYGASHSSSRPLIRQRVKCNGVWSEWVNCDPAAFAPSGYGLGVYAKPITDANTATTSGWYRLEGVSTATANIPYQYVLLQVNAYSDRFIVQNLYRFNADGSHMKRVYSDGWGEWEWVTPPMALGVEYRTTKRYDGHAVYTQMISCGKGPASGGANYYLNLSTNNVIFTQIRCKAVSPTTYWGAFLDHYILFGEYGSGAPCISLSADAGD